MALSILNNIPSLAAQNQLSMTGASLQKTLFRLSSGSRINSGADDAAGLAIADGLHANVTALTQSARNANDGVGMLQVADGALAQVSTLLNRAVTLATEASTGTVTSQQRTALDTEYTAIKSEIDRIGTDTNFNGSAVFSGTTLDVFLSDSLTNSHIQATPGNLSSAGLGLGTHATNTLSFLSQPAANDTVTIANPNPGGSTSTYKFVSSLTGASNEVLIGGNLSQTVQNLSNAINGGSGSGVTYGAGTTANAWVNASNVTATNLTINSIVSGTTANAYTTTVSSTGNNFAFSGGGTLSGGTGSAGLTNAAAATAALTSINTATQGVAATRGQLGAAVNRLQSAVNVMNAQTQNLSSAEDGIRAADIAQEVANMTKFNILQQTGISALAQANQMQQGVLSLLK
jgi:flagellin